MAKSPTSAAVSSRRQCRQVSLKPARHFTSISAPPPCSRSNYSRSRHFGVGHPGWLCQLRRRKWPHKLPHCSEAVDRRRELQHHLRRLPYSHGRVARIEVTPKNQYMLFWKEVHTTEAMFAIATSTGYQWSFGPERTGRTVRFGYFQPNQPSNATEAPDWYEM